MAETDWHTIEEARFAAALAEDIKTAAREHLFNELVVMAPPKTHAELRREWSKDTEDTIVAEIPKDYTNHPTPEVEKLPFSHRPSLTLT